MLAGLIVVLVLLAATVGVLLAVRWTESTPACRECAVETELIGEDCTDLGGGWLRGQRVYSCPRCLATFQVDRLIGPSDFADAV